ncbi:hypothetical protein FBUS_02183 [Fasciolopsis buskii]|uniref:G-protein coupled receptors family 1 profile domain-containing protein n=1 Tax=Fasciolopsis buskii TaxID=27845 RepID=A0A8E0S1W0_9TREM|nr:hypothetical protein FBUS_02183 [Fasciolopsis buski]
MWLFSRNQSCSPVEVVRDPNASDMQAIYIFIVSLSPVALGLSTFALIVLTRRRAIRLGSMRVNLTTLTVFEALLNAMIFMLTVSHLTGLGGHNRTHAPALGFTFICFFFINGALCARNWIITLIALARCIAITRPMTTRLMSTHLFRPKLLGTFTVTCILLGFILSLLRMFEHKIVVCENLDEIIRLVPNTGWHLVSEIFFIYQSAMPISIVFIITAIMIIVLLRNKTFKLDYPPSATVMSSGNVISVVPVGTDTGQLGRTSIPSASETPSVMRSPLISRQSHSTAKRIPCSASHLRYSFGVRQTQMCAKSQINYRRTQNQLRATRMITLLAAAFILFEAPIFFCVALKKYIPLNQYRLITNGLKALVVLDSCANVVIYLFMSKRFRQESSRLWTTVKGYQSRANTNHTDVIS